MNCSKNRLFLFWNIGKNVYEKQKFYDNSVKKFSDYFSYRFGNSHLFTRENIHLMKRFYLNFPIYDSRLEEISWEQYQLLLNISNKNERNFYWNLTRIFHSDYQEMKDFINNNYYLRI